MTTNECFFSLKGQKNANFEKHGEQKRRKQ